MQDFGDLSVCSKSISICIEQNSWIVNWWILWFMDRIEFVTFASTGDATDFGDDHKIEKMQWLLK